MDISACFTMHRACRSSFFVSASVENDPLITRLKVYYWICKLIRPFVFLYSRQILFLFLRIRRREFWNLRRCLQSYSLWLWSTFFFVNKGLKQKKEKFERKSSRWINSFDSNVHGECRQNEKSFDSRIVTLYLIIYY